MEKDFVTGELLAQGAVYTVMGILIVFLILIIIMFVIKAMALFSAKPAEKPATEEKIAPAEPAADETDESELVAVITAAIAASLNTSASSVVVKSYKKVGAWNMAGRREILDNRF